MLGRTEAKAEASVFTRVHQVFTWTCSLSWMELGMLLMEGLLMARDERFVRACVCVWYRANAMSECMNEVS